MSFTFAGEAEASECEPVEASEDGSYTYAFTKAFERTPGAALVTTLLNNPLTVTVYKGELALGTASIDLAPFSEGAGEVAGDAVALTPLPLEGEEANPLLPTASIAVSIATSEPLMTPDEAAASAVLTLAVTEVAPVPESLVNVSAASEAPFNFTVGMPMIGVAPVLATGGVLDPDAGVITWSAPTKCWMPGASVTALKELIKGRGSTVPLEVARFCTSESGAFDPAFAAYHAVCDASLDDLLNPGATTATGKPLLKPLPMGWSQSTCLPLPPAEAPEGSSPIAEEPPADGGSAWSSTSVPASVAFSLILSKPLLAPFKPPAPTELSVSDLLPQREPPAPLEAPNTATEAFRAEVLSVAGTLSEEYAAMFTGEPLDEGGKMLRRKGLVFELNRSGKYHAMKERLKDVAQAIIKERFFAGGEGVQGKYNELYVHLVDEMHAALRALGTTSILESGAVGDGTDGVDHDKLAKHKSLADEYEVNGELDIADKWHQERLLITRQIPEVWAEYGAFLARCEKFGKAEEAYKESLGCDPNHVPALVALCALMIRDEEYGRAEVYGQAVTSAAAPADPVAWSLLAATYSALERETDATNCNYEARRLAAQVMAGVTSTDAPEAFVSTALLLLDLHMPEEACALLQESGRGTEGGLTRKLCLARVALLEGVGSTAYGHLMDALSVDATDPRAFELLGDLHVAEERLVDAEEAYTHAMALCAAPNPPASLKLILNLGNTLLAQGKLSDAKGVFMAGCGLCPCASTWLGAGIAMLRDGDMDGAEAALAEANILDHTNAKVWGYLCLVALLSDRVGEAEQALGTAFRVNITDAALLAEVGKLFLTAGKWKHAEGALRRSVKHGGGLDVRLALGKALAEQNDAEAAMVELKAVVEGAEAAGDGETLGGALEALVGVHGMLGEEDAAAMCRQRLAGM